MLTRDFWGSTVWDVDSGVYPQKVSDGDHENVGLKPSRTIGFH
jgi:hypothetical protein